MDPTRSLGGVLISDVVVVGAGPGRDGGGDRAGPGRARRRRRRQGRVPARQVLRRRADDAGAARARGARVRPRRGRRLAGRRRRRAALAERPPGPRPAARRARARTPRSRRGCSSTTRSSTSPSRPGRPSLQGHGFDGIDRRARRPRRARRRRPRARSRPRYVVAADGMWSPVRKALGLAEPGYLGEWHAFRQYVRDVDGTGRPRPVRLVRRGPPARLRVVVPAARRAGQRRLRRAARRHPADPGHEGDCGPACSTARTSVPRSARDAAGEGRHTAWPIPARIDAAPLTSRPRAADRRRGDGHRRADRARASARRCSRAASRPRRSSPAARSTTPTVRRALRVDGPPPPRRRPPHVGPPRPGARPRPRRPGRHRRPRPRRRVGPAQLRPLDVRGRAAGDRPHAVALAPPRARRPGRVRRADARPVLRIRPDRAGPKDSAVAADPLAAGTRRRAPAARRRRGRRGRTTFVQPSAAHTPHGTPSDATRRVASASAADDASHSAHGASSARSTCRCQSHPSWRTRRGGPAWAASSSLSSAGGDVAIGSPRTRRAARRAPRRSPPTSSAVELDVRARRTTRARRPSTAPTGRRG